LFEFALRRRRVTSYSNPPNCHPSSNGAQSRFFRLWGKIGNPAEGEVENREALAGHDRPASCIAEEARARFFVHLYEAIEMKFRNHLLVAAASALAASMLGGCESHDEGPPPPPPPQRVVVVEPGYYYEPEYYDADRVYHAPVYYYYDGHHYERRDEVPHGYVARVRPRDGGEFRQGYNSRGGEYREPPDDGGREHR
jgi:hypothetical protein